MTILFSGDWHLCMRNLESVRTTVAQVVKILRKAKRPAYFVHLGDILGDRGPANPVDQRVVNYLIQSVGEIKEECDGFLFVRGNHDMIATPDDVPSCVPLLYQAGVDHAADDNFLMVPMYEETEAQTSGRVSARIWMIPYFRDAVRQKNAFAAARNSRNNYGGKPLRKAVDILAFHNEVKGCERNAHSKGEGLTLADIGASDYDLCVAGHIHRPQQMGNVHFVGSPFCADWGDVNDSKRLLRVEI